MAMSVELPALERTDGVARPRPSGRLGRWARPAIGLLLPLGVALAWEILFGWDSQTDGWCRRLPEFSRPWSSWRAAANWRAMWWRRSRGWPRASALACSPA